MSTCYAYLPTQPVIVTRAAGDDRPPLVSWALSARMTGVRVAAQERDVGGYMAEVDGGLLVTWERLWAGRKQR